MYRKAAKEFKKISHLRGQALASQALFKRFDQDSSQLLCEHNSCVENSDSESFDGKQEPLVYENIYREKMRHFKYDQALMERDSCISRNKGEVYSLLTEIVKSGSVAALFNTNQGQNAVYEQANGQMTNSSEKV